MAFGAETTADQVLDGIDLAGRNVLITGGSGGLGAEAARALAARGAHLTLAVRDAAKGKAVADQIRERTGSGVDLLSLELGSAESTRACAAEYLERHDTLHVLINNAGIMACALARTERGHELQLGTNHLGHFELTTLLLPALRRAAPSRIVSVSSGGHRLSGVDFEDPNYERRPYDKWEAYGQSKTANVLFAVELDRRLADDGVRANAVHPGVILTELGRHLDADDIKALQDRAPAGGLTFKPVEAGAATHVYAAASPDLEGRGGLYLEDCHVAAQCAAEDAPEGYAAHAIDPESAARLWTLSERLTGAHA